ncbi:MAG: hypothetical protein AAF957_12120 [Planctomycetota bacterium]
MPYTPHVLVHSIEKGDVRTEFSPDADLDSYAVSDLSSAANFAAFRTW